MRLLNLMHECIYSLLKRPAVQRASKWITSHTTFVPSLLVVKRVASTFVEVSVFFWVLCLLADANTADRTLCKYL